MSECYAFTRGVMSIVKCSIFRQVLKSYCAFFNSKFILKNCLVPFLNVTPRFQLTYVSLKSLDQQYMFFNKVRSVGTYLLLIISIEISSIHISIRKIGLLRDFQHLFTAA